MGVVVLIMDWIVSINEEIVEVDKCALDAGIASICRGRWKSVAVISWWEVGALELIVKVSCWSIQFGIGFEKGDQKTHGVNGLLSPCGTSRCR